MAQEPLQKILRILSIAPLVASAIVALIIYMAFKYEPEDIPGMAYVVSFTLAEGMMLVAAIGILSTVKIKVKSSAIFGLRYANIAVLTAAGIVGFVTFMQMAP